MAETDSQVIYFNARVHGMKSHLFTRAQVEELLAQGDLQKLIDAMLESSYRTEMAEALTRYSGADAVEEALSRNLANTFNHMLSGTSGEFGELVRVFLTRWDLAAVKGLLRSRHWNLSPEETELEVAPGPTLPVALMRELAQLDSMPALVNALLSWNRSLCHGLRAALDEYNSTADLAVLEDALDRAYFVDTLKNLKKSENADAQILAEYLQAEVDRINLRSLFLAVEGGTAAGQLDSYFLPGGKLGQTRLKSMAASGDLGSAFAQLENTSYSDLLEEYLQYVQSRRFAPIERYFERMLMRGLLKLSRRDVFGIGVMMNYVWLKYNEVINLRLIARGLAGSIPMGRVKDELYFAG
jgi:V/A-type H+-transporting ATPase subunit C